jgi:hypothetical protein
MEPAKKNSPRCHAIVLMAKPPVGRGYRRAGFGPPVFHKLRLAGTLAPPKSSPPLNGLDQPIADRWWGEATDEPVLGRQFFMSNGSRDRSPHQKIISSIVLINNNRRGLRPVPANAHCEKHGARLTVCVESACVFCSGRL